MAWKTSSKVRLQRWLEILLIGVFGAATTLIGLWYWKPALLSTPPPKPPAAIQVCFAILVLATVTRIGLKTTLALTGSRHAIHYPPRLIGLFAGAAGALWIAQSTTWVHDQLGISASSVSSFWIVSLLAIVLSPFILQMLAALFNAWTLSRPTRARHRHDPKGASTFHADDGIHQGSLNTSTLVVDQTNRKNIIHHQADHVLWLSSPELQVNFPLTCTQRSTVTVQARVSC